MKRLTQRFFRNRTAFRAVAIAAIVATGVTGYAGTAAFAQQQAAADSLTPTHVEVARDVVVLSGMGRTFDGLLPTFGDQVRQTFITRPEISSDLNTVLDALKPELEERKNDILNNAARILAARLNEDTLVQIRDFFRSTAGQQYVATQPLVLDDLFAALNTWVGDVSTFLISRVREEMRKRGHEI